LSLDEVIRGWAEVIPKFKTGTFSSQVDGTISFDTFGTGVMFLPSGLAYFSSGTLTIPSYAPLVFSFKLHNLRRRDHDRDGIFSMHEYGPNFDDDAIEMIAKVLNISDADADKYRRIFAKNDKEKIEEFKKLIKHLSKDEQDKFLTQLSKLSSYGFCKAHAFSYAQLVYNLAYMKERYHEESRMATLNNLESG
jgi:hypothetical protein